MNSVELYIKDLTLYMQMYESENKAEAISKIVETFYSMAYNYKGDEKTRADYFVDWFNTYEDEFDAEAIEEAALKEHLKRGINGYWEFNHE